jgi:hypothetical protein
MVTANARGLQRSLNILHAFLLFCIGTAQQALPAIFNEVILGFT